MPWGLPGNNDCDDDTSGAGLSFTAAVTQAMCMAVIAVWPTV